MIVIFCCSALFQDVAILFGVAQNQNIHGRCNLEGFLDTNASECQTIIVVQYLGTYKCNVDLQIEAKTLWCWILGGGGTPLYILHTPAIMIY